MLPWKPSNKNNLIGKKRERTKREIGKGIYLVRLL